MLHRTLSAALTLSAFLLAPFLAFCSSAPNAEKRAKNDALFTNGVVRSISIEIAPSELAKLKKDVREYVHAKVKEGTNTFEDVGLHLKGVGSFRPIDQKPSFTIKFNKFTPRQEFYGLSKIALNNSVQDSSYINEAVCTELFRSIGVPAPRVTHSWVRLNGRDVGLYVLIEGINKDFLRRHFKSDAGNLYEGYTQDINEELDQDNGEDATQKDLRMLAKAANEPNSAERWLRMEKLLNVDAFISMMAGEVLMGHWDGYWINRNNYRIYHDPAMDRWTMIPSGLDNMWQHTALSWRPTMSGLLTRAVLMTPEGNARYRSRISALLTNEFRVERITNRVEEIVSRLRPEIKAKAPETFSDFGKQVALVKDRIVQRLQNVKDQLAALAQPIVFDTAGHARLTGWKSQIDGGDADFSEKTVEKKRVLTIHHKGNNGCVASWRARAVLSPGRYRFEGNAKTTGIMPPNQPDTGLAFRVSGEKVPPQITKDGDWRKVAFEFSVQFPSDQAELVCELTCLLGEAWLDADSLQLIRLQ